jgi:Peptidase family M23
LKPATKRERPFLSLLKLSVMKSILFFMTAMVLLTACKKDNNTTPPQLTVPFVNTSLTQRFIPFGEALGPGRENPAYEITLTDASQKVVAACGGKINWVRLNSNFPDYEIQVVPFNRSVYRIYYDHVLNPAVSEGQTINAGDIIGTIGTGSRTELQVNDNRDGEMSLCPIQFGNTAFNSAMDLARSLTNSHNGTSYSSNCLKDKVKP